jgi:hypothetical protein
MIGFFCESLENIVEKTKQGYQLAFPPLPIMFYKYMFHLNLKLFRDRVLQEKVEYCSIWVNNAINEKILNINK